MKSKINKDSGKLMLPHYLILILLLLDPNFNLLRLINYSNISVQGVFKIWDIFIILIIFNFFFYRQKSYHYKTCKILNKYILFLVIFVAIYIFYTDAYAHTATIFESFKMGRNYLYLFLFFIYLYYLNEEIIYKFWLFYKYIIIIAGIIYALAYAGIYTEYSASERWAESLIIRDYLYCPNTGIFLSIYFILSKIIGYKGKYKITDLEFLILIVFAIVSLARNLWISYIVSLIIILIISAIKISSRITFNKQIKYLFIITIVGMIVYFVTAYTGSSAMFIDRILGASEDIRFGVDSRTAGTFTTRLETLDNTMSYISYYGLEWTGVGFAHTTQSAWVINISRNLGYWGTEMMTGQNLMTFGYIGVGIWYLIWLIIILKIFKVSINAKDDFVFLFGTSLALMLFVMFFVSAWASTSTNTMINLAFLLAMFVRIYSDFEVKDSLM